MLDMTQTLYNAYEESCEQAERKYNQEMDDFKCDAHWSVKQLKGLTLSRQDIKKSARVIEDLRELANEYPDLELDDAELWTVIGEML